MSPEIQFLSTKPMLGYGTTEMRCVQPASFLREAGWRTATGSITSDMPVATRVLILHRVPLSSTAAKIVRLARLNGIALILDLDDLIEASENAPTRSGFARGIERMIATVDHVTVSTEFLLDRVARLNPQCSVLRNALSRTVLETARSSGSTRPPQMDRVTLGYFSGSAHHDADFGIIEPALLALMRARSDIHLLIAGKLNFSPEFHDFQGRFRYEPFRPYAAFIALLNEIDINLVPLDTSSDFAQARSELKYIEAGAFGIPSVASPTVTYRAVIEDGVTGRLCAEGDWFSTLDDLAGRPEACRAMGRRASDHVRAHYTPEARGAEWNVLLARIAGDKPPGAPGRMQGAALQFWIRTDHLKRSLRRRLPRFPWRFR